ncbi:hypothetical protein BC829DRAFT_386588 [Chytridium lagenaria]|nr:hypothetical protein BC829DRAFT_386588 [Chytridium lagenaria]
MACPATVSPVCGSNGITYNSECDLRNAACGITGLKVARQGACDGYTPTLTTTTAIKTAATTDGPVSTSKDGIIISGGSKIVGGVLTQL